METGSWADLLGQALVAIGLLAGAFQFYQQRKWQSKQFAADKLTALKEKPEYLNMLRVLAWSGYEVDLFPEREASYPGRFVTVRHSDIIRLIQAESSGVTTPPTQADFRIMAMLDTFLTEHDQIAAFVESGLFRVEDVTVHLEYVLWNLASQRSPPSADATEMQRLWHAIYGYVVKWHYRAVQRLVERYAAEHV